MRMAKTAKVMKILGRTGLLLGVMANLSSKSLSMKRGRAERQLSCFSAWNLLSTCRTRLKTSFVRKRTANTAPVEYVLTTIEKGMDLVIWHGVIVEILYDADDMMGVIVLEWRSS